METGLGMVFVTTESENVTIEYTSEPIRIQRGPKYALCKQHDDLPIVREGGRIVVRS